MLSFQNENIADQNRIDLSIVEKIVAEIGFTADKIIPILQAIQARFNYLPEVALRRITEISEITPAAITGVSTFYSQFRHMPVGKHLIRVCNGTACHVKGADFVYESFRRNLKISRGQDTDEEKLFTLQKVACLGCCTLAPVVQIDQVTYGHVKPDKLSLVIKDFLNLETESRRAEHTKKKAIIGNNKLAEIRIGLGSCCIASGSGKVQQALEQVLAETSNQAKVKRVGCVGMCHQTPLLEICKPEQASVLYARVQPEQVREIVFQHFTPSNFKEQFKIKSFRLLENLLTDEKWESVTRYAIDGREKPVADFLNRQKRIATEFCGAMDPLDLNEYQSCGGFLALKKCLAELTPEQVIGQMRDSGLRGRGGAGFPTGEKWQLVRQAIGEKKYVVCNGDEGDPGAFMDRMILESYPYRVIEGMMVAAYAVGADEGYFYIRAEYPLAVKRIREALMNCYEKSLLGNNILGSHFSFHVKIMEGAGAFVCGEETALLQSIEGKRGMPYVRPPYPAEKGLWGKPTLVNNAETFATVPWIFRHSAEEFAGLGTKKSQGTKVFALAGKIARGGLIEVPMGITIRQIVEEIGGGTANGNKFKAVQIGGPSGGCLPAELSDISIDYEELTKAGAMMGSGGLLVLDETDCMVDIARYFLTFTQDQSCGKCTFCRIGTRRLLDILERICSGQGKQGDLEQLESLAQQIKQASLCGLGKTAPNPVLTTLKYFRHEYEAHLSGTCPAKKCTGLIQYLITDDCIGCTICAQKCPVAAIPVDPYEKHQINQELCTKCGTCRQVCPKAAVRVD